MKIGYDAKRAFSNFTGLGNYSRSTLRVLSDSFPEYEYYLYTPRVPDENQITFLDLPHHAKTHIKIPKSFFFELFPSLWRRYGITSELVRDNIQIYHGLSHELPVGIEHTTVKSIVTIHDLIFKRFPEYYKPADRKIYDSKFSHACKVADLIIAISEQTKKDIIHYYKIDEKKIRVVYQSCAPLFQKLLSSDQKEIIRKKYNLPENYLLNVGTIEKRKNALLIIKALRDSDISIPLVIVGRKTSYYDELVEYIEKNKLQSRVIFLHDIKFEDLPAIYQSAKIFIYPSRYEGFGIPIIEALFSNVSVIAATGSCLEEAGGRSSIYVNPDDVEAMKNAITTLLKEDQQERIKAGRDFAEKFEQHQVAASLISVYKELM